MHTVALSFTQRNMDCLNSSNRKNPVQLWPTIPKVNYPKVRVRVIRVRFRVSRVRSRLVLASFRVRVMDLQNSGPSEQRTTIVVRSRFFNLYLSQACIRTSTKTATCRSTYSAQTFSNYSLRLGSSSYQSGSVQRYAVGLRVRITARRMICFNIQQGEKVNFV